MISSKRMSLFEHFRQTRCGSGRPNLRSHTAQGRVCTPIRHHVPAQCEMRLRGRQSALKVRALRTEDVAAMSAVVLNRQTSASRRARNKMRSILRLRSQPRTLRRVSENGFRHSSPATMARTTRPSTRARSERGKVGGAAALTVRHQFVLHPLHPLRPAHFDLDCGSSPVILSVLRRRRAFVFENGRLRGPEEEPVEIDRMLRADRKALSNGSSKR